MKTELLVGELAKAAGVTADTIRFYGKKWTPPGAGPNRGRLPALRLAGSAPGSFHPAGPVHRLFARRDPAHFEPPRQRRGNLPLRCIDRRGHFGRDRAEDPRIAATP